MESSQVLSSTVTFSMGVPASVVTTPESAPVSTAATDTSALGLAADGVALGEDCSPGSTVGVGVVSDPGGVGWTPGGSLGAGIGAGDDGGSGTASAVSAGVSEGSGDAGPDGAVAEATTTDDDEGAGLAWVAAAGTAITINWLMRMMTTHRKAIGHPRDDNQPRFITTTTRQPTRLTPCAGDASWPNAPAVWVPSRRLASNSLYTSEIGCLSLPRWSAGQGRTSAQGGTLLLLCLPLHLFHCLVKLCVVESGRSQL